MRTKKKLAELVDLSSGVHLRAGAAGDAVYLTGKLFDERGAPVPALWKPTVTIDDRLERHRLQDDDLLIFAKGLHHRVLHYREEYGPALASTLFTVLRVKVADLLPDYLHWYLNDEQTQAQLRSMARGSGIPSLSKKALQELKIPVPDITTQRNILRGHRLWQQQQQLYEKLIETKRTLYQRQLLELAGN